MKKFIVGLFIGLVLGVGAMWYVQDRTVIVTVSRSQTSGPDAKATGEPIPQTGTTNLPK